MVIQYQQLMGNQSEFLLRTPTSPLTLSPQGSSRLASNSMELPPYKPPAGVQICTPRRLSLRLTAQQLFVISNHKTPKRGIYNTASASVPVGTEALLHNHRGFVTESAIANIVFEWQGELFTPPVSDGLLPGTLRESLIANGEIGVRPNSVEEQQSVEALLLVNAPVSYTHIRAHETKANTVSRQLLEKKNY